MKRKHIPQCQFPWKEFIDGDTAHQIAVINIQEAIHEIIHCNNTFHQYIAPTPKSKLWHQIPIIVQTRMVKSERSQHICFMLAWDTCCHRWTVVTATNKRKLVLFLLMECMFFFSTMQCPANISCQANSFISTTTTTMMLTTTTLPSGPWPLLYLATDHYLLIWRC